MDAVPVHPARRDSRDARAAGGSDARARMVPRGTASAWPMANPVPPGGPTADGHAQPLHSASATAMHRPRLPALPGGIAVDIGACVGLLVLGVLLAVQLGVAHDRIDRVAPDVDATRSALVTVAVISAVGALALVPAAIMRQAWPLVGILLGAGLGMMLSEAFREYTIGGHCVAGPFVGNGCSTQASNAPGQFWLYAALAVVAGGIATGVHSAVTHRLQGGAAIAAGLCLTVGFGLAALLLIPDLAAEAQAAAASNQRTFEYIPGPWVGAAIVALLVAAAVMRRRGFGPPARGPPRLR